MNRIEKFIPVVLVVVFLVPYYLVLYLSLIKTAGITQPFPVLKERLGTVLWHAGSSLEKDEFHTYCYYPGKDIVYFGKGNEYILRKVDNYSQCRGWYGVLETSEARGVSEINRLNLPKEVFAQL